MSRPRVLRSLSVALSVSTVLAVISCSRPGSDGSVLEAGATSPPQITELAATVGGDGSPQIRGSFTSGKRTIRFFTHRGPRIPLHEVMAGANEFEIDACFVNEHGDSLVVVAGGHENKMPECTGVVEGRVEGDGASDTEGQAVAAEAMEVLRRLPFQTQYRPEQGALTGTLDFLRRRPAPGDVESAPTL